MKKILLLILTISVSVMSSKAQHIHEESMKTDSLDRETAVKKMILTVDRIQVQLGKLEIALKKVDNKDIKEHAGNIQKESKKLSELSANLSMDEFKAMRSQIGKVSENADKISNSVGTSHHTHDDAHEHFGELKVNFVALKESIDKL